MLDDATKASETDSVLVFGAWFREYEMKGAQISGCGLGFKP